MGIDVIRFPVSGPAGVRYAYGTGGILVIDKFFQVADLALGLIYRECPLGIDKSYAGTVIASVFQSVKSFDQDGGRLFRAHISNYSTHNFRF